MQIAKKVIDGSTINFHWADGTVTAVDTNELGDTVRDHATMHGFSQKLGDSYSGALGDLAKAKVMFQETLDALRAGDWNRKGGGFASGGIWVEAYAKAANAEFSDALEKWNGLNEEEKAEIRKHPAVKLAKAEIEADRAKAKAKASDAPAITL